MHLNYILMTKEITEFLNIRPAFLVKRIQKQGQNLKSSWLLGGILGKICKLVSWRPPNKKRLILFISHISMSLTETRKKVKIEHSLLAELDRFQSNCGWSRRGGGISVLHHVNAPQPSKVYN